MASSSSSSSNRAAVHLAILVLVLAARATSTHGQFNDEDDEDKRGKFIATFQTYHHQVSGSVYAVDAYTLLLTDFSYDGKGADTFFWAGTTTLSGPQGFIVPDEYGKTNVLARYHNKDFTLTLPDGKKISDIKRFAVYDLSTQQAYGDITIAEEFDPPAPRRIAQLSTLQHNVSSESIVVLDAKTISIPALTYDGLGEDTHFFVGQGSRPSPNGVIVPDEHGYLDPIRAYKGVDVVIVLPGDLTISKINWLSIYDVKSKTNYGYVSIPEKLSVPPSLIKVHQIESPEKYSCIQLHKKFQLHYDINAPSINFKLVGQMDENDYMAWGVSGSDERSQMEGADLTVAYMDDTLGYAVDYNVTAKAPCTKVLGQYKGVCKDELVGGQQSNQLSEASRRNGITSVSYRRALISPDPGDKEFPLNSSVYIVWAMGRLDERREPSFHEYYPKGNVKLNFKSDSGTAKSNCMGFQQEQEGAGLLRLQQQRSAAWPKSMIFDRSVRTFRATIGPAAGRRGYQAITGQTTMGLAWYINGLLAPELYLRRGLTYSFQVFGGNNPHSAELYHPLIITDEPHGGFDRLSDLTQSGVRVLAGIEFTRRGRPRPTAVGPLCLSKHREDRDRRLDDEFPTFQKFNRTLISSCEPGEPGILEITPNSTWPDVVYYNSFTHANMGWKIQVIDAYSKSNAAPSASLNYPIVLVSLMFFTIFNF
ncbi:hypothetical protein TKK_0005146 [Trichogramma kaykai]|uniref:DOMON domain-containing protein n=1 Tax=Trichogramma kaykai TaxID=54128 RepID=A0ABD2XIJ5_9HYME